MNKLAALSDALDQPKLPPVHSWHPSKVGEIDIQIKRNGDWFYQGSLIQRKRMVKLFSTVLRVDDDQHTYLVTPVEKLRITVDASPFVAVLLEVHDQNNTQSLAFTTNVGDVVVANKDHPVWIDYPDANAEPEPKLLVRDKLTAMLSRSVYYQLAEIAAPHEGGFGVFSEGVFMPLAES